MTDQTKLKACEHKNLHWIQECDDCAKLFTVLPTQKVGTPCSGCGLPQAMCCCKTPDVDRDEVVELMARTQVNSFASQETCDWFKSVSDDMLTALESRFKLIPKEAADGNNS